MAFVLWEIYKLKHKCSTTQMSSMTQIWVLQSLMNDDGDDNILKACRDYTHTHKHTHTHTVSSHKNPAQFFFFIKKNLFIYLFI